MHSLESVNQGLECLRVNPRHLVGFPLIQSRLYVYLICPSFVWASHQRLILMLFSINRRKNNSNSSKFHKSLEHKDGELPGLTTPYFMNHHVQNTNCYLICRFKCFNNCTKLKTLPKFPATVPARENS